MKRIIAIFAVAVLTYASAIAQDDTSTSTSTESAAEADEKAEGDKKSGRSDSKFKYSPIVYGGIHAGGFMRPIDPNGASRTEGASWVDYGNMSYAWAVTNGVLINDKFYVGATIGGKKETGDKFSYMPVTLDFRYYFKIDILHPFLQFSYGTNINSKTYTRNNTLEDNDKMNNGSLWKIGAGTNIFPGIDVGRRQLSINLFINYENVALSETITIPDSNFSNDKMDFLCVGVEIQYW